MGNSDRALPFRARGIASAAPCEWIKDVRRGGQPLTSGPARVMVIRAMTRRSWTIAAR